MDLPRLTAEETRDLVTSMGGRMPDNAHTVIAQLSRGRPFFVTSVVRGDGGIGGAPAGTARMGDGPRRARLADIVRPGDQSRDPSSPAADRGDPRVPLRSALSGAAMRPSAESAALATVDRSARHDGGGGPAGRFDLAHRAAIGSRSSTTRSDEGALQRSTTRSAVRCTGGGGADRANTTRGHLRPRLPLRSIGRTRASGRRRARSCGRRAVTSGPRERRDDAPDRRPRRNRCRPGDTGCASRRSSGRC